MQLHVHVYLLNDHFSQEHADAQHGGEESENNRLHDWEDEFMLTNPLNSVETERHGSYTLNGTMPDGNAFSHTVPDMLLFNLHGEDGSLTQLAFSESIIDSYTLETEGDLRKLAVFIRDFEPHANPVPGVYIASRAFPEELID